MGAGEAAPLCTARVWARRRLAVGRRAGQARRRVLSALFGQLAQTVQRPSQQP